MTIYCVMKIRDYEYEILDSLFLTLEEAIKRRSTMDLSKYETAEIMERKLGETYDDNKYLP